MSWFLQYFNNGGKTEVTEEETEGGLEPGMSDMKAHIFIRLATTYIIRNNKGLKYTLNTILEWASPHRQTDYIGI